MPQFKGNTIRVGYGIYPTYNLVSERASRFGGEIQDGAGALKKQPLR